MCWKNGFTTASTTIISKILTSGTSRSIIFIITVLAGSTAATELQMRFGTSYLERVSHHTFACDSSAHRDSRGLTRNSSNQQPTMWMAGACSDGWREVCGRYRSFQRTRKILCPGAGSPQAESDPGGPVER